MSEEAMAGAASALTVELGGRIKWTQSADELPEFNRLVLAFCDGFQEHSGVTWRRDGFAFMVRHDEEKFVVKDKWASSFYDKALTQIGADVIEVTHWVYLDRPVAPPNAELSGAELAKRPTQTPG